MRKIVTMKLDNEGIDTAAERLVSFAPSDGVTRKNVLRTRIFLEEVMARYQQEFGEDAEVLFEENTGIRYLRVAVKIKGPEFDPFSNERGDESDSELIIVKMLDMEGIAPAWTYRNGYNILSVSFLKKRSTISRLVFALILSVVLGTLFHIIPGQAGLVLAQKVFQPIYNSFNGIISFIAGPLIFLTVLLGVVSVGSVSGLSKIGKRLLVVFLSFLALSAVAVFFCTLPFIHLASESGPMLDYSELYQMVLDILPNNLVAPFLNGNSLQIVCIAIFSGVAMLFLSEKVIDLKRLLEQLNFVVQWLMNLISQLVPAFIFINVFNLIVNGQAKTIISAYKLLLMFLISIAAVLVLSLLSVSIREKVSPLLVFTKNLPAALIGLTTASSSAAYSQNIRTCRRELGISETVTNIGISLGQTVFKPGVYLDLFLLGVFCAEFYSVPLSLGKLISFALFCYILSIAAPPVPGGGLTCFALLTAQLGLPGDAVALMCTLGIIPDFLVTSLNMCTLQQALVLIDGSLGTLDRSVLKSKKA